MSPKQLVFLVGVSNLVAGVLIGIALDRAITTQPTVVEKPVEVAAATPAKKTQAPEKTQDPKTTKTDEPRKTARRGHKKSRRWKGRRGGGHLGRLVRMLELDEEQTKQAKVIFESRHVRFKAVFEKVRPELKALRAETDAELKKILRPEQAAKLKELEERRRTMKRSGRDYWRRGRRGRRGPPGPDGPRRGPGGEDHGPR